MTFSLRSIFAAGILATLCAFCLPRSGGAQQMPRDTTQRDTTQRDTTPPDTTHRDSTKKDTTQHVAPDTTQPVKSDRGQQVGHDPLRSPYEDTEGHIDMYLLTGYWSPQNDLAGVAPRSGPMIGFRYDAVFATTPVFLTGQFLHVFDDRTVLDPSHPHSDRIVEPDPRSASLNIGVVEVGLQLTGQKTFHGFIPVIEAGPGLISDFGGVGGPGHYHLGTQFTVTAGVGIRWVPSPRFSLRADANNFLFPYHYPQTYKTITGDGTSVIPTNASLISWRHNGAFTFGAWYALFR